MLIAGRSIAIALAAAGFAATALGSPTGPAAAGEPHVCTVIAARVPANVDVFGYEAAAAIAERLQIPTSGRATSAIGTVAGQVALLVIADNAGCAGYRVPRLDYERLRRAIAGTAA